MDIGVRLLANDQTDLRAKPGALSEGTRVRLKLPMYGHAEQTTKGEAERNETVALNKKKKQMSLLSTSTLHFWVAVAGVKPTGVSKPTD